MANEYVGSTGQTDGLKAKAAETLSRVQDSASSRIEGTIDDKKSRAADTLSGVAESLLSSSHTMRERGNADASRYIEKAADQIDRLASYLDRSDVHEVFDSVESFARRQPAAFVAGAFAVGFLASRFLKSARADIGTQNNFSGTGRTYGLGNTGSAGIARGYDAGSPRTENWRTSGYSASETSRERDIVGDPSVRTSVGLETGSGQRQQPRDVVGDPSVRTSVGLETNSDTNRPTSNTDRTGNQDQGF
jgi:hypothetical protein